MPPPKLLLPFTDYCRVFRVIYSVLDTRAHTHRACIFFAVAGAIILREHYQLNAVSVAGAAAYMVDSDTSLVATFGKIEDGMLVPSGNAFHCWVECEGYAIDFMAPVFRENLQAAGILSPIARKMFQRPLAEMAETSAELDSDAAFSLFPSSERTQIIIENFKAHAASGDLANICSSWYRRPPKRIAESLDMVNDLGIVERLKLHGPEVCGVW
jgi:Protein of unknown function (DUF2026)